jgi:hypothetical protein
LYVDIPFAKSLLGVVDPPKEMDSVLEAQATGSCPKVNQLGSIARDFNLEIDRPIEKNPCCLEQNVHAFYGRKAREGADDDWFDRQWPVPRRGYLDSGRYH